MKYKSSKQRNKFRKINLNKQHDMIDSIRKLRKEQKYGLALSSIEKYLEKYGWDCYIKHQYALYYEAIYDFKTAKTLLEENILNDTENKYYSMYELAMIEYRMRNYLEAESLLNEIIASDHPDKSHAMLGLAKVNLSQHNNEKSEEILKSIIANKYKNKDNALIELVFLKIVENKYDEANYYLSKIENTDNLILENKINYFKGEIEYSFGNLEKANGYFMKAIELGDDIFIFSKLGLIKVLISRKKFVSALEELEKIKDPNLPIDYWNYYIRCLIKIRNIDKASELIDELKEGIDIDNMTLSEKNNLYYNEGELNYYDKNYLKALLYYQNIDAGNNSSLNDFSIVRQLNSLIKLKRYEEAYQFLIKNRDNVKMISIKKSILLYDIYLSKQLGYDVKYNKDGYVANLILNYDKEKVLEHISKHKKITKEKDDNTVFNEDIDIEKLYLYAQENISEENYNYNDFNDIYLIRYDNVGNRNGEILNYIKVITIANTDKIVSIYPINIKDLCLEDDDLEEENNIEVENKPKVKQMSRIDKFNQKYGFTK